MNNELLDIVDENNNFLGIQKSRALIHKESKDWHRVTAVWVINENREVLCQKRSLKAEVFPGQWQSYFGGHLESGESYEQSAIRELEEELNLIVKPTDLKFVNLRSSDLHKHWVGVYLVYCKKDQKFIRQNEEIDELKWVDLLTLEKMFQDGEFCNKVNERMLRILKEEKTI